MRSIARTSRHLSFLLLMAVASWGYMMSGLADEVIEQQNCKNGFCYCTAAQTPACATSSSSGCKTCSAICSACGEGYEWDGDTLKSGCWASGVANCDPWCQEPEACYQRQCGCSKKDPYGEG